MGVCANGAGEFADGSDAANALESFEGTAEFITHQCELESKGGRLAVNAVAASDARRHLVFLRAAGDDGQKRLHIGDKDVRALHHLHGEGGVHDIGTGETKMQPATGGIVDLLGNGCGETDDVVVERFFQFLGAFGQRFRVGETFVGAGLHLGEILGGDDALFYKRSTGQ
ncbi:MAG: hypothetical protein JW388_1259 [Nitrospira sp.]|nr:hypothetical protein [Nitrospira sp.]